MAHRPDAASRRAQSRYDAQSCSGLPKTAVAAGSGKPVTSTTAGRGGGGGGGGGGGPVQPERQWARGGGVAVRLGRDHIGAQLAIHETKGGRIHRHRSFTPCRVREKKQLGCPGTAGGYFVVTTGE